MGLADVAEALDRDAGAGEAEASAARAASSIVYTTPCPVASARPADPPMEIGLPVTTPGTE